MRINYTCSTKLEILLTKPEIPQIGPQCRGFGLRWQGAEVRWILCAFLDRIPCAFLDKLVVETSLVSVQNSKRCCILHFFSITILNPWIKCLHDLYFSKSLPARTWYVQMYRYRRTAGDAQKSDVASRTYTTTRPLFIPPPPLSLRARVSSCRHTDARTKAIR
jgi:hypothetical protein